MKDNTIMCFNSFTNTNAENEFLSHLEEMEEKTTRVTTHVNSMKFRCFEDTNEMPEGLSDEELDTVNFGTKLFLSADGVKFKGVRDCGISSIYDRVGLDARKASKMPSYEREYALNRMARLSSTDEVCLIVSVDGKVSAVLSDGESKNSYRIIRNVDMFHKMKEIAENVITGVEPTKFGGTWTYTQLGCRWVVDRNATLAGKTYKTAIFLSNSETGVGSMRMSLSLDKDGMDIPVMTPISLAHRKRVDDINVADAVSQLENAIDSSLTEMEDLEFVTIHHVVRTIKSVSKTVGLPKKNVMEVISRWELTHSETATCNALELYMLLAEAVSEYCKGRTPQLQRIQQSNLLKVKGLDWSLYDLATPFEW